MLPVVEPDGLSTARRIILYSVFLIPVSLLPSFMGMSGRTYLVGALFLGIGLLYFGVRLTGLKMPVASATSKLRARHLLQATVIYLPILFVIMMTDAQR
jgi:protoheme IX farnesyltransferase